MDAKSNPGITNPCCSPNFSGGITEIPFEQLVDMTERVIPPERLEALRQSIATYGLLSPLVVMRDAYVIIDGVARYQALKDNPPETVPVVFVTGFLCDDVPVLRHHNKFRYKF